MKCNLKSSFFVVVIAGAMTTTLLSMDSPPASPAPSLPVENHHQTVLDSFSKMTLEELDGFVHQNGWHELHKDLRKAITKRTTELKAAANKIGDAAKGLVEDIKGKAENLGKAPAQGSLNQGESCVPLVDPLRSPAPKPNPGPRKSNPSRFEEWYEYVHANKMRTALIAAGIALGSDLIYAYHTKINPVEKQNNGFGKKLLLAASRTKIAALLGGAKNILLSSLVPGRKA